MSKQQTIEEMARLPPWRVILALALCGYYWRAVRGALTLAFIEVRFICALLVRWLIT